MPFKLCKMFNFFLDTSLYISMIQRQNKDGCANGGVFTTDNVTNTA